MALAIIRQLQGDKACEQAAQVMPAEGAGGGSMLGI